jgi:hypothetical protein
VVVVVTTLLDAVTYTAASFLFFPVVLPGVVRPMALGFKTDEIQRRIAIGDESLLFPDRR